MGLHILLAYSHKPPPPYDEETWHKIWRIISRMKVLRELRITVWNEPKMDPDTEAEVFGPLKAVTAPDVFNLELPWEYMGGMRVLMQTPRFVS